MRILFVTDKDEIRGPMARALCLRQAENLGVLGSSFDSTGIYVVDPCRAAPYLVDFLKEDRLDISRHLSKPLQPPRVRASDLVLCMTASLARRAKARVEERYHGKILILNEAVGFDRRPDDIDIALPERFTQQELVKLYSRVKAATGRLVRMIREGNTTPQDFGATVVEDASSGFLDDPQVRPFLVRYVLDLVQNEGPIATRELVLALDVLGRPLSVKEVEELLRIDLRDQVRRNHMRKWEPVVREKTRQEQPRREGPRQDTGPRTNARSDGWKKKVHEKTRKPPPTSGKSVPITFREALELLAIKDSTSREEAQKAYYNLLKRYHPDRFQDDPSFREMAEQKTKRVNEAWALLKEKLPE